MNTVEPVMTFGQFVLLFIFLLWAGGAVEWVWRHWQRDRRERQAVLHRSKEPKEGNG